MCDEGGYHKSKARAVSLMLGGFVPTLRTMSPRLVLE